MKKLSAPLMLILAMFVSFNVFSLPSLSSLPTATATIYLDFDGQNINCAYWNGGTAFTCAPSTLTDIQIIEVYNRVAEDYRPFNINITTDESKFLAAPLSSRIRVVVTPTSAWFAGAGGVSFIGSFKWGDDTPAFVFLDRLGYKPKLVAECCSHESGHTVGLSHQSKYDGTCALTSTYNDGIGTGETSWAPIMGNSYYRNMSGWNDGPTPYGCASTQDNLSIITTQNGFTYRTDDYSNDINNNPFPIAISGATIDGIITTNTDKDAFTFTLTKNAIIHIDIKPYSVDAYNQGANLDVKVALYDAAKKLVSTFDPINTMSATIDTVLNTGTYYMVVDGAGNSNIDNYGSLGSYTISSSAGTILPIQNVSLNGKIENNKHVLGWKIISDEPVKQLLLESSTDGTHFTTITTPGNSTNLFVYTPAQNTDLYYRLKVTSVINQTLYSNIILLKGAGISAKSFTVSTFIRNEITVNATENYNYLVSDVNGNAIAYGNGKQGLNKVDMGRQAGGLYVLQILSNNKKQTERIIKQ
jgi:hypothetical protein